MKLAGLFSGGKDSTFAVWKAVQEGHDVVRLVTFAPENPDSYMFHHPNIQWTRLQAEVMGMPITMVSTKGEKEQEVDDLEHALKQLSGIDGVTAGALASRYQKERVERVCRRLGLKAYSPGWHRNPEAYWQEILTAGFRVLVTKVACEGLGREWLGREIDAKALEELKQLSARYRFHLAGEGGEFETIVLDCPLFRKRLHVRRAGIRWEGDSGVFLIDDAVPGK